MTIRNFTFFSPTGTEFPVSSNADAKLYLMLSGMELDTYKRKDWDKPVDTALNRQYSNTSLILGGRYFELEGETVALQPSADNYIHANIDLTNPTAPVSLSAELANNSNAIDINNASGVLKHCFDIVKTDTMGVIATKTPIETTVLKDLKANSVTRIGDVTEWTPLLSSSGRGEYKKEGKTVTIRWNFTSGGNYDIAIGTLPEGCRPKNRTFAMAPLSSANNIFHAVQINSATGNRAGAITLFKAQNGNSFTGQYKFDID
jgi:hypothetical protein